MLPSLTLLRLPNPSQQDAKHVLFTKTHLRNNTVGVAGTWGWQGLEAEVVGSCLGQSLVMSALCGRGGVGTGGSVSTPAPNTDQSIWSWLDQGKKGERGQASVFNPSG